MNVAIVGCGLIGKKRAAALQADDRLVACCDTDAQAADTFANLYSCKPFTDLDAMLAECVCDVVIVAVINKHAKSVISSSLKEHKHVLAEKPLGRNVSESREIVEILRDVNKSRNAGKKISLKTGFNHRFHPAIQKAKELTDSGAIGRLMVIRASYGHGGRPGMEREWRASKELCGGGELLDQGVHIIDLIRWFGGEVAEVSGAVRTVFWNTDVEDNAFAILRTIQDVTASMHVSWTNWKNTFSFEVFGKDGYIHVQGLGGSYGLETLEIGRRKKEGGRPDIEIFEFPQGDSSWINEWREFKLSIHEGRNAIGSGEDGLKSNAVVDAIYRSDYLKKVVTL